MNHGNVNILAQTPTPGTRTQYKIARDVMGRSQHGYTKLELLALARLFEMADLWTAFVAQEPEVAMNFEERLAVRKVTKELRKK